MINHASRASIFGVPALVVSLLLGLSAPAAASEATETPPPASRAPGRTAEAPIVPDATPAPHPALVAAAARQRAAAAALAAAPMAAPMAAHDAAPAAAPRAGTASASTVILRPAPAPRPIAAGPVWTDASGSWRQAGAASWYGGPRWHGKKTASGERYNENMLTAAHASLPIGSQVRVTVADSGRTVVVTINDRPGTRKRIIDLSRAAAIELGILGRGIAHVHLTSR